MNATIIIAVVLIGFASGLRALTAVAVVAWAAFLSHIDLSTSWFAFMASPITVGILSLLAIGEYVGDKLEGTPPRTELPGLTARILMGSLAAVCLLIASGQNPWFFILGTVLAVAGAFAGYQIRTRTVTALGVKDWYVAVCEDLITIGIAVMSICLLRP